MMNSDSPQPLPGQIGPYRILQLLGEGGMGVVYEAEETGPVRRRVAVKVMRAGLNSREVMARFDTERQALAVMNHPGIARVLGVGATSDGQPYFAMELVRGLPITRYCDTHRLSIEQRIELFIAVCHAVQHAHQKGVTHRDLKPTNILVTEQDGAAQPKIIDFGIAKALGHQLTELTLITMSGHAMGTAAYMSPEQADPAGVDTDTRADIFSLGVLLYELLVGELPVDPETMGLHLFLARLAAGEANPPTPSSRLHTNRQRASSAATTRGTDAEKLRRRLRGDLDWIVMKAMAPERSRRYDTANGLALDLRRFLSDEPVLARPPSVPYWVGKFMRRHRVGVAVGLVGTVAVLAATVMATVGFVRASRAERMAAEEAQTANALLNFVVDLLSEADPARGSGPPISIRDAVDVGARNVGSYFEGQPRVLARMLQALGGIYLNLGEFREAQELASEALRIQRQEFGPNHETLVEALVLAGDVARHRGEHDIADSLLQRAISIGNDRLGAEHLDVASALAGLGALRIRQGNYAAAESLYRVVLPLDERLRDPRDPRIARNIRNLGTALYSQDRLTEAETLYHRVLEIQERTLGSQNTDVAGTLLNLGAVLYHQKRFDYAERMYQRALDIYEIVLPPGSSLTAAAYNNLGEVKWKLGEMPDAERLLRQALAIKELTLGPNHTSTANTLHALAGVLRDQRRYPEAEPLYRRALTIRTSTYEPTHRDVLETKQDYGELLRLMGRPEEARQMIGQ
jgi:non-specific serine/threonine protein kinase/serine/threonine-protein kinase